MVSPLPEPKKPFFLKYWLMWLSAKADNHRTAAMIVLTIVILLTLLTGAYIIKPDGRSHVFESARFAWLQAFGGAQKVDRAVDVYNEIYVYADSNFDRLDIMALTVYVSGSAFREQIANILNKAGHVRILVLDPRVSDLISNGEASSDFSKLAAAFTQTPEELREECWYSTSILLKLREKSGSNLEIRLITKRSPNATPPYFLIGRSYHRYSSKNLADRLDFLIPRIPLGGHDSSVQPALRVRNRPNHPEVVKFTSEFELMWNAATPLNDSQAKELKSRMIDHGRPNRP